MAATTRKRGRTWEHSETVLLLEKWGEENMQERLKGCSRKKPIWEEISVFLKAAGFEDRDYEACKTRIHTLVNAYRLYKDQCSRSGNGIPTRKAPFFEQLDDILSNKPLTKPTVVINSAAITITETTDEEVEEDGSEVAEPRQHGEEDLIVEGTQDPLVEKKPLVFTKKAKRQRMTTREAFGSIDTAIGDFIKYQQEADKHFLESEVAREKREEEREMERRREDQEFFLRLAEILKK